MATPLAVTVAELLQNAVEHAFDPENAGGDDGAGRARGSGRRATGHAPVGHVDVTLANDRDRAARRGARRRGGPARGVRHRADHEPRAVDRARPGGAVSSRATISMATAARVGGRRDPGRDLGARACPPSSTAAADGVGSARLQRCAAGWALPVGGSDRRRAASGGRPATPCAACGAPPRRCRPRRRTPGWWPGRSRGTARARRTSGRRAWPPRSGRRPGRSCRRGRRGPVRCCDRRPSARQSSASQSTVRFHMSAIGMCLHHAIVIRFT